MNRQLRELPPTDQTVPAGARGPFPAMYEAGVQADRLKCAECDGSVETHFIGRDWYAWCTRSRGEHRLRQKGMGPIRRYVLTGEGTAITRMQAETRYIKMAEEKGLAGVDEEVVSVSLVPLTAEQAMERITLMERVVSKMEEGTDYGVVPGTRDKSLWLPGAELLRMVFNIPVRHEIVEYEEDLKGSNAFVRVRVRTYVQGLDGQIHYEVFRSCSSMEGKWGAWRRDDGRKHELIDLVPERAQKRGFVHAIRHITGAGRYFKGASIDAGDETVVDEEPATAQPPSSQEGISAEKCPIHGTQWYGGRFGSQHKITGSTEYCNSARAYLPALEKAMEDAGESRDAINPFIKDNYDGRTWGDNKALSPADRVEIIEAIAMGMMSKKEEPEPAEDIDVDEYRRPAPGAEKAAAEARERMLAEGE